MSRETVLKYHAAPSFLPSYRKIMLQKRRGLKPGQVLPRLAAEWNGASIDPQRLAAYREVCGLSKTGELPILYPHVLTGGLHLAILAHDSFPLSMLGAVHMRINALQHRPISPSDTLDMFCRLETSRVIKAGIELDVTTVVSAYGSRVWESVSTYLVRGKYGEPGEPSPLAMLEGEAEGDPVAEWHVMNGMGRRYAKVCGDYNPIHLTPLTAKLFGFKRDIVHGMWSAAACLSYLKAPADNPQRCDLLFKGPVFMDSHVALKNVQQDGGHRFDLFCGDNPKPVIQGAWRAVADDTVLIPE
ncbi:MAG: hypothetical protein GC168_15790 [Candidatus Hydrogenedens sp.]|nr:hypothetical protein [Candidatus Hydrogenedens sp.]